MKISYLWDSTYKIDEIIIQANPVNKEFLQQVEKYLKNEPQLEVIHPKNERKMKLAYSQIQSIEAMGHLSKVYTKKGEFYYTKGRLKELEKLSTYGIVRINNSTLLNIEEI